MMWNGFIWLRMETVGGLLRSSNESSGGIIGGVCTEDRLKESWAQWN